VHKLLDKYIPKDGEMQIGNQKRQPITHVFEPSPSKTKRFFFRPVFGAAAAMKAVLLAFLALSSVYLVVQANVYDVPSTNETTPAAPVRLAVSWNEVLPLATDTITLMPRSRHFLNPFFDSGYTMASLLGYQNSTGTKAVANSLEILSVLTRMYEFYGPIGTESDSIYSPF
jgi:hypothetical protein